jgi:Cdc6-like AAA superfamily ATPase
VPQKVLAGQLAELAEAARAQASEPEHQMAIGSIEAAKAAAEKGDESKALAFLRHACLKRG